MSQDAPTAHDLERGYAAASLLKNPDIVNEYVRRYAYIRALTPSEKALIIAAFNAGREYEQSLT